MTAQMTARDLRARGIALSELRALAALIRRPPLDDVQIEQAAALRIAAAIDVITAMQDREAELAAWRDSDPNSKPEGTVEALAQCADMLELYMPECMPANERGQISFVRCMTDATVAEIRAFLASATPQVADDNDTAEARLDMVRVTLRAIVDGGAARALAKAGLDFCDLTQAEREAMRGETA